MRPAFRQTLLGLHRWLAFALGLPVVVVVFAGALLVFRPELAGDIRPPAWPAGSWTRVAEAARAAGPASQPIEIVPRGGIAEALLGGKWGRTLTVDPGSGRILADEQSRAAAFPLLFRLHTRLLAGPWAEWVVAAAGLALLAAAVTGAALAWPVSSRAWRLLLRVRLGDGWRPLATDLHRVIGVAAMPLLAINALTGLVLVFSTPVSEGINAIAPKAKEAAAVALPPCAPCTLDDLVARAEAQLPGARAIRVVVRGEGDSVIVRMTRPGENATQGMNRVQVDPSDGTVRRVASLDGAPAGNALFEWLYPLHTGRLPGVAWRGALALAGLAPLLALATGGALWIARRRRGGASRR